MSTEPNRMAAFCQRCVNADRIDSSSAEIARVLPPIILSRHECLTVAAWRPRSGIAWAVAPAIDAVPAGRRRRATIRLAGGITPSRAHRDIAAEDRQWR
ncbi:MAG TPA: hypothetical protein VGC09_16520 [Rhodopila sp.]